ncbi:MAG: symmetrical bis(5'-nucleosyl)-tetraphosphatase [Burkholderiaceae bacterium]|jgi:bis(5'-nucleosyl)-tetraphosphatase (symmetrical)|nr:symmetrical bis(5'-nucleosyl)-tetraphosphatase [Burkholderiaceae bacterium]
MVRNFPSRIESRPETWAIGDVQGCLDSLLALLPQLPSDARLWLVGDLVNRGPRSLDALRWAIEQGERVVTVLGNHDLHLLAVAAGIRRAHRTDTLDEILAAPDRDALLDWVRTRPLAHFDDGWLMVHAGVLPQWSVERTLELAYEVHRMLSGPRWLDFLREMYGNEPATWSDSLRGNDRLRVIVNALTRIRFCTANGRMEFAAKEGMETAPAGYLPWFDVPGRASAGTPIVFGHWAALGWLDRPNLLSIDTGCVWGRELTAVRLQDRRAVSVGCSET